MSESPSETVTPVLHAESLDPLGAMMLQQITEHSETIAKAQKVVDAANADDAKLLVMNLRDTHPQYEEWQALVTKAEELVKQIDADNAPKVKLPSAEEVEIATKTIEETREAAKVNVTYMQSAYAGYDLSEIIPSNLAKRRGRKPGSTNPNAAGRRPRLKNVHVNMNGENVLKLTADGEGEAKASFSNLAKFLTKDSGAEISVKDLQTHAFTVAETEDLSEVNGPIEFTVTIGDEEESRHYEIAIESR